MQKNAYFVVWLSRDLRSVVDHGVYSEPKPTAMPDRYPVCITEASGDDYAKAKRALKEKMMATPNLNHWTAVSSLWA